MWDATAGAMMSAGDLITLSREMIRVLLDQTLIASTEIYMWVKMPVISACALLSLRSESSLCQFTIYVYRSSLLSLSYSAAYLFGCHLVVRINLCLLGHIRRRSAPR